MKILNYPFVKILITIFLLLPLNQCGTGADARKYPPEPEKRVKKNLEEGRGFRLMGGDKKNKGGDFEFASSNELWRASLDTIDFMPLASANYSGGLIITDWYSSNNNLNESIKISIRFLTNEIRSDALNIKVFYKKCALNENCAVSEKTGKLTTELKKKILKKASIYQKQNKVKNFKPYKMPPGMNKDSAAN
tara:strand:- start:2429 stop:3004 length:576 start_codon:yes stop_codon:yes gene_type:complete